MAFFLIIGLAGFVAGGPLATVPPLGWNTWTTCAEETCGHDNCNEEQVKSVALAMQANGMQDLGYEYVNLDDCWAYPRGADGKLRWDPDRFPSGIPALATWLHNLGFKFGLYTSAGNQTCSSGGRPMAIPGSRDHYDLDAKTFAEWEVDYVKLDWCGDIKDEIWLGPKAHKDFWAAMKKAGRDMHLEVVAGYLFLLGETPQYANSWRFCEDHHDAWSSTTEAIACRADLVSNATGGVGGWAFMDFVMTGGAGCKPFSKGAHCPGMTDDEYRTGFAIWTITQSPIIVSTDVRDMTAVMNQTLLNKAIIDIHQSTATPPGSKVGFWPCANLDLCMIWARQVTPDSSQWIAALVNMGNKDTHRITAQFTLFGHSGTSVASVTDMWSHEDLPQATGELEASVLPHATALFRLTFQ